MQQIIQQIEQWAEDRNLIHGSTPEKQMLKLMEEFGELCGGIAKNKPEVIKDSIGDCFVVLVILNKQIKGKADFTLKYETEITSIETVFRWIARSLSNLSEDLDDNNINSLICDLKGISSYFNLSFKDCVQYAYDQIKDRKGRMVDGVFVKEEDLNE